VVSRGRIRLAGQPVVRNLSPFVSIGQRLTVRHLAEADATAGRDRQRAMH
jgi:hypothetical protein